MKTTSKNQSKQGPEAAPVPPADQEPAVAEAVDPEVEKQRLIKKYANHAANVMQPGGSKYTEEESFEILRKIEAIEDQVYKKAEELSNTTENPHDLKTPVKPIILVHDGELVIGYLREPPRMIKYQIMDAQVFGRGIFECSKCVHTLLVLGHSDPRLSSLDSKYDALAMSVALMIYNQVEFQANMSQKL